jgi:hypothetical protein
LLTAIGLTPGGSSTVHICTQTIHTTTQLVWEECGPCPVFASYTLAFALQPRKKHGKTSVRVASWHDENRIYRTFITIRIHKLNNKNTQLTKLNKSIKRINIHKRNNTKTQ